MKLGLSFCILVLFITTFFLWIKVNTLTEIIEKGGSSIENMETVIEEEEEEAELAHLMGVLQRHTHKVGLSIDAKNKALTKFYLHETEEVIEEIEEKSPEHDGFQISELLGSMVVPKIEALSAELETDNWEKTKVQFGELINSCNQCHTLTKHPFIRIAPQIENPYLQDFSNHPFE